MSDGMVKVLLTTPTTPKYRMKAIVEAAEGFVYLVRSFSVVDAPHHVHLYSFFCYLIQLIKLQIVHASKKLKSLYNLLLVLLSVYLYKKETNLYQISCFL